MEEDLLKESGKITNEELVNLLLKYPKDAVVLIEYCHPRCMKYNKEINMILID